MMTKINLVNKTDFKLNEPLLKQIAEESIAKFSQNDLVLEIIFVDQKEIQELNSNYRKKDVPTDVLSFPQAQVKNQKVNILGSIIICPKVAEERNEPFPELIKHGVLHLFGYDHEEKLVEWNKAAKLVNCNF